VFHPFNSVLKPFPVKESLVPLAGLSEPLFVIYFVVSPIESAILLLSSSAIAPVSSITAAED